MRNVRSTVGRASGSLLMLLVLCPASAFAHILYVYAQVEGKTIEGRAYFPGDVPAQKSAVIARDAAGRELGRTTTDDAGKFTFTVREHVDYYLVVETPGPERHSSRPFIVHAAELPDRLPADVPTASRGSQVASPAADPAGVPAVSAGKEDELTVRDELTALRKQIQELRREIYESAERNRFRDFLGGIGFILGLAGVALYMMARRRRT